MSMYILYSKNSCFETETSDINLRARHAYYYQVQTQMQVCDVQFCDFVLAHLRMMYRVSLSNACSEMIVSGANVTLGQR